jgi:hypothetical protein
MSKTRKIGIILVLFGLCLPAATLPFISEFHPLPEICLTSNFFGNLGNMVIAFGKEPFTASDASNKIKYTTVIPYKYIFSSGVILTLAGMGFIVLSGSNKNRS